MDHYWPLGIVVFGQPVVVIFLSKLLFCASIISFGHGLLDQIIVDVDFLFIFCHGIEDSERPTIHIEFPCFDFDYFSLDHVL